MGKILENLYKAFLLHGYCLIQTLFEVTTALNKTKVLV